MGLGGGRRVCEWSSEQRAGASDNRVVVASTKQQAFWRAGCALPEEGTHGRGGGMLAVRPCACRRAAPHRMALTPRGAAR